MRCAALAVLAAMAAASPAWAANPLSPAELDQLRGGLATPLGIDIGFGATARTYVDGRLVLETRLTWTADGAIAARALDGGALQDIPVAALARPDLLAVAPGVNAGFVLDGDRIASVLTSAANGVAVRQDLDIVLQLPQLAALQDRIAVQRLAGALEALSASSAGLRP